MKATGLFLTLLLRLGISLCIIVPSLADYAPVLLWDGHNSGDYPIDLLGKTSQSKFTDIIKSKLGTPPRPVQIFWTDNFCLENITQHVKEVEQLKSSYAIPLVESPVLALESLFNYNFSTLIDREPMENGQIIVNSFDSVDSIPKMVKNSQKDAVVIITGRSCKSVHRLRQRRAADATPKAEAKFFRLETAKFLLYADKNPMLTINTLQVELGTASGVEEINGTLPVAFTIKADFATTDSSVETVSLSFDIISIKGYYYMEKISMKSKNHAANLSTNADVDIVWPAEFSYHCLQNTTFSDNSTNIIFENLQVQAYETATDKKRFGDPYDCVGFTSIPIWSGIFVTAILALIMICGLTMLMDIRTMDRFDDPKGKTITISAQE